MTQTIFPVLRYENAREAIDWLCNAFGFKLIFSVPTEGAMVRHARLMLGESVIMIGSTRIEEEQFKSPSTLGVYTQALCVYISDIESHYQQALSANAKIVSSLEKTDFGTQEYHVEDCEGHLWIFTTPADIPEM